MGVTAALLAALAVVAVGCSGPPKPRGWAPAEPVAVSGTDLVLVPFKGKVFALRDNSSTTEWQFPPQDKDIYPVSDFNRERIDDMIDALSIEGTAKNELKQRVEDLTVDGPSKDALTNAMMHPRRPRTRRARSMTPSMRS